MVFRTNKTEGNEGREAKWNERDERKRPTTDMNIMLFQVEQHRNKRLMRRRRDRNL
jgi:hypothetical protein